MQSFILNPVRALFTVCLWLLTPVSNEDYCSDFLISGPTGVSDDRLSASTFWDAVPTIFNVSYSPQTCYPKKGRLFLNEGRDESGRIIGAAWCPINDIDPSYLQVDFDDVKSIRAIKTQGRGDQTQWLTNYKITYSLDNNDWLSIQDNLQAGVVFPGNHDSDTVITNRIPGGSIIAKSVRIHPVSFNWWPALRVDFIGCTVVNTTNTYELEGENKKNDTWRTHPVQIADMGTAVWNKTAPHLGACAIFCQKSSCKSFTFDSSTKMCTAFSDEFLNGVRTEIQSNLYYIRTSSLKYYLNLLRKFEYTFDGNAVFRVYTKWTTASDAAAICLGHNTTQLIIRSVSMLRFFQRYVQNNLILSQIGKYGVDGKELNGSVRFSDGTVIPETVWAPGHPKNNEDRCVALHKNGLKSRNCDALNYFICGFEISKYFINL